MSCCAIHPPTVMVPASANPARRRSGVLDLQKLATFRAVAAASSFTLAAAELGYRQSSVTCQIKVLERELGVQLFDRKRFSKDVALTAAGRRTLKYADRLLALASEAIAALQKRRRQRH